MKIRIITAVTLASISIASIGSINAQSFKEKMKAKIDKLDKKIAKKLDAGAYTPNFKADTPQDVTAKSWKEDSYAYYQQKDGRWSETNKTNVTFLKNDNGDIKSVKLGGGEYKLKGLDDGFGKYYYYDSYSLGLVMDDTIMVVFKPYNYSIVATVNKKISNSDEVTPGKIEAYVKNAEKQLSKNRNAIAEKKAAERKAKYGLEGKDVASIKVVNLKAGKNGKIGCYSLVTYDIEATLKNGTVISTAKGGYKSDYEIKFNDIKLEAGKIKPAIAPKDVFSVDVKVKSKPSISTRKELTIPYNQAITFNWSGTSWSRSRGTSARNVRLELKQTKHTETGEDLLMARIKGADGAVLSTFKISPDMNIIISLLGGNGGTDDGAVFGGGNGGTVTVIKDPNVKFYSLDARVRGGNGGRNRAGRTGPAGRDGQVKEETRPVKF